MSRKKKKASSGGLILLVLITCGACAALAVFRDGTERKFDDAPTEVASRNEVVKVLPTPLPPTEEPATPLPPTEEPMYAEYNTLVVFYNSTGGENWLVNDGWLGNSSPCTWHGIKCKNNQVVQLALIDNNLIGQIPPEIADLVALEELGLSGNQLSGEIPAELGALSNLTYLDLTRNDLSGQLPPELGNLRNLTWLGLSNNPHLSGIVPIDYGQLVNLESFSVRNTQLSGPLPESFINLTKLNRLWVEGSELCKPTTEMFETWLARIEDVKGIECDFVVELPPTLAPAPISTCDCSGDLYNCGDFPVNGVSAQACFDYCNSIGRGDVHRLDRDGDGLVCEGR